MKAIAALSAALSVFLGAGNALSQPAYPDKPVRIIVGFTPGVAPDLPTMGESGYPGFEAVPWFGLMVPAGTPVTIVEKLHRDSVRALSTPEIRKKFTDFGLDVLAGTPAELAATIASETPRWAKLIKQAGIKATDQAFHIRVSYL